MNFKITKVMVTGGPLYDYFAGIVLVGRVSEEDGSFVVHGCLSSFERRFYGALLTMDRRDETIGFDTVEDVEEWWLDGGDGLFLTIDRGLYQIIE